MTKNVDSVDSSRALILAASGLLYLYFVLSFRCLLSGLPVLTGLFIHWAMEKKMPRTYPRLVIGGFALLHFAYWISNSSYILYSAFTTSVWVSIGIVSLCRYEICYRYLAPIEPFFRARVASVEEFVQQLHWPILDFDGQGILALTGSKLALMQMTFDITGIDFSFQVDEHTKIIAKMEGLTVRLARDVTIREVYVKFEGHGTPASEYKSFNPVSRASTASSTIQEECSRADKSLLKGKSPLRKVPPPVSTTQSKESLVESADITPAPVPPKLPPRLPPRNTVPQNTLDQNFTDNEIETEEEQRQMQEAMAASLATQTDVSRQTEDVAPDIEARKTSPTLPQGTDRTPPTAANRMMSFGQHSTTSYFYPAGEDTDPAELKAAFEEGAIHHTSSTDNPEHNDFDMKAAIAASLEDQAAHHKQQVREKRVQLSELLAKIPWWLKITPGPLATRLLLSPLIWLHPIKVTSVAATGTGKRITNLMETSGLKKSHPNQEIFNLIRKVFVWLEAGDISVVLNDIAVRPHIPIAADHDVRIDITAHEPTAYRNTGGTDDVLAKINAISATLEIPTFLLPNHEYLIPKTVRSSIPVSVLFSLPGVFNRELLTIGAAFIKATTMMDLRHTAQTRAPPPMPSLSGGGQFSFRSLGQAVKQAAGDLAKQKGVQWGVRDAELAKWTAKLARLMAFVKIDVGGKGEIPVDLMKLRRKVVARELEREQAE